MESFRWKDHSNAVLSEISRLYSEEIDVDCCFLIENKWLKAHKVILCACSPYFKDLFAKSSGTTLVTFQDITYSDMKCILNYIYYGVVEVPSNKKKSFLDACHLLQLQPFQGFYKSNFVPQTSETDDAHNNEYISSNKLTAKSNITLPRNTCSLENRSTNDPKNNLDSCEKREECKASECVNHMVSDNKILMNSRVQVKVDNGYDYNVPTACGSIETSVCDSEIVCRTKLQSHPEIQSMNSRDNDTLQEEEMILPMEQVVIKSEIVENEDEENTYPSFDPLLNPVEVNDVWTAKKNINEQLHKEASLVISAENSIQLAPNCGKIDANMEDQELSLETTLSGVAGPSVMRTRDCEEDLKRCFNSKEGFYECPYCSTTFLQQKLLSVHLKCHRSETLSCPACPLVFLTREAFKKHQYEHEMYGQMTSSVALDKQRSLQHLTHNPSGKELPFLAETNASREVWGCDPSVSNNGSLIVQPQSNPKESLTCGTYPELSDKAIEEDLEGDAEETRYSQDISDSDISGSNDMKWESSVNNPICEVSLNEGSGNCTQSKVKLKCVTSRRRNRDSYRFIGNHFITRIPSMGKKTTNRRRCVVCSKNGKRRQTAYWCVDCQVGLCADSCFKDYHTKENY